MTPSALFVTALLLLALLFVAALTAQRLRAHRQPRPTRATVFRTGASLGNALHQLQQILRPPEQHVIELHLADEDPEQDPDTAVDPTQHLLRQAHSIRRGNPPDRLTAIRQRRR